MYALSSNIHLGCYKSAYWRMK